MNPRENKRKASNLLAAAAPAAAGTVDAEEAVPEFPVGREDDDRRWNGQRGYRTRMFPVPVDDHKWTAGGDA